MNEICGNCEGIGTGTIRIGALIDLRGSKYVLTETSNELSLLYLYGTGTKELFICIH